MRHLSVRKTGMGLLAVLCLLWLGAQGALAQGVAPNVARVSYVQGSVQLLAGQGVDFQQAVSNMPVLDGSRLQTGGDGQVEVEFGDGSVARLTPNSSLQFNHVGLDQVQLDQLSGLGYYEFNVGEGHPPFGLQFADVNVQPTANSILRVGLDMGWEVAVFTGAVTAQENGRPPVNVGENQSLRSTPDNNGAPYTLAQGINGDSWDNWNQDRDQAIAQEATQQTPVRDDSANPQNENWNDLDADGNWYPVAGSGNVWVPAGVGPDWDPYGSGYWAFYPTLGYTWVSGYSWGWLPYHCGVWNYYPFGWGWVPGGCGRVWSPVIVVRTHPPGWSMPLRPPGGIHPVRGGELVAIDRGPAAKGPWAMDRPLPKPDHQQALNVGGRPIAPIARTDVRSQGLVAAKGTAPGTRAVLSAPQGVSQRPVSRGSYMWGANPPRAVEPPDGGPSVQRPVVRSNEGSTAPRPPVGYTAPPTYNQRSTYVPRPMPSPHYSAPPPAHSSAPAPHASAPPAHH